MEKDLVRVSITLPTDLLEYIDNQVVNRNYSSRSEFIRDILREQIVDDMWQSEDEVIGVLTIIYDHHRRELSQKMVDIQHNDYINIMCSTHIHLDHYNCLETIILKGKADKIIEISNQIAGLNGVKFAKLTKTANIKV
ncbi:MAG: nickel-responsive transcriptional regulator NikR [Hydrogenothermaceae bacterium]|nr:nickel-responsive transcriptional regulator NikR [Hydrogenothermaceae bacterium]